MIYNRILQLFVLAALVCSSKAVLGADFIPLGKLRPTDAFSDPYAVSADGGTVVGVSHTGTWSEAVRWTIPGGIQSLGAGQPSEAYGVSANGSVIVGRLTVDNHGDGFRWTAQTGLMRLGDLPGGTVGSGARDVSADGSVVVGTSTSANGAEAYRWTEARGMVGLGLVPGDPFGSFGSAVSADGSVIVGDAQRTDPLQRQQEAFRWTAANGMVGLGDLPGGQFYSEAFDVSADGSVIVGRSLENLPDYTAFRWTNATGMVSLPPVPGVAPFHSAEGVSGDGTVIVGLGAFVWDEFHGSRSLEGLLRAQGADLTGWSLIVARAASYDGLTIVGLGSGPDGGREAWVARLDPGTFIPEPSSLALSALGLSWAHLLCASILTNALHRDDQLIITLRVTAFSEFFSRRPCRAIPRLNNGTLSHRVTSVCQGAEIATSGNLFPTGGLDESFPSALYSFKPTPGFRDSGITANVLSGGRHCRRERIALLLHQVDRGSNSGRSSGRGDVERQDG